MLMLEFLFEKRKARISLKYYFSFKLKKIPLLTVVAMSNHHKVTFCPFTIFIPIYINTKQMSSAGLSRYCLFLTQAGSSKRKVVRDFEKKKIGKYSLVISILLVKSPSQLLFLCYKNIGSWKLV